MIRFTLCDIKVSDKFSLTALNWQIEQGQTWVVVGPNGSGKSALGAALTGEFSVTSGDFESGSRVSVVSLEEQSRLIQRERQRDDSDLTDEVGDGTPVHEMLSEESKDPVLLDRLIETLGMRPLLERGFRKLSTGETRKVLLVRALTSHPEVLVLDEPFEGLDIQTVPKVRDILESLSGKVALVLCLNRIEEVPDFTTHAIRMEQGRMAQRFNCDSGKEARSLLAQISQIRSEGLTLPPPEQVLDVPLNDDGSLVSLIDARVAYTDNVVFEHLNWAIRPGEHWQVKGPNGSGKTCLLGLVTGDHPQCYVNDLRLFGRRRGQGETIWQLKAYMGFVSTSLHWDYRLSVGVRNVIVSGFYDSIGLYQKATDRQLEIADTWLALLGLQDKAMVSFSRLSYGEQRVLLIARAMVKHPPLLLLDEPCLGLDDANRQLVLALTERISDEGNTTLVYVTHHQEDRIRNISNELVLG
ncbi:MAG: molybdate ABC transporter ATP-binding protein ModF [Gammaproteobacteria bacterium]|jgi:molybdate transport system ATP-binding protein|nr:molybdate ABC transporter ATP-binding protein ModF [Gammaproteobacteria bacterium]